MDDPRDRQSILRAEDLVSKNTRELVQLQRLYETKIQRYQAGHPLRAARQWIAERFALVKRAMIASIVLLTAFVILGSWLHIIFYVFAFVVFTLLMVAALVTEDQTIRPYQTNVDTISNLLAIRDELKDDDLPSPELSSLDHKVLDALRDREYNLSDLLSILRGEGHNTLSDKTLRKRLRLLIDNGRVVVEEKPYASSGKRLSKTKVYSQQ